MAKYIIGISAYYHDSAAVLLCDGEIIAAVQEERFTRIKQDASFPTNAIKYLLNEANITRESISYIAFYDKPFIKFERLLETYHAFAPKGLNSFLTAIPVWIKEKLFMKKLLNDELAKIGLDGIQLFFPEHHLSHAASAFYPSPFDEAAILTIDGVGEWATTTIGKGYNNNIEIIKELHFPHSIGLLYSAFTYYTGFIVNSGEYKLMGLAPYGQPNNNQTQDYISIIKKNLIDIREDGSILLNMEYFDFATGLTMTNDKKWERLFGIPRRMPESAISQPYMDLAWAIQQITEEVVIKLASTAKSITNCKNLVLAGGVALNCVANGKLINTNLFDEVWIQPAAGDAGGALGAAYAAWHIGCNKDRKVHLPDAMQGAYLGPEYSDKEILSIIRKYNAEYVRYDNFKELCRIIAGYIADGKVIGWFQGRMEFGPRALGNRSIIGDARNPEMQKKMNLKIKFREGFRPFAPSVLEEDISEYFESAKPSPYMLVVQQVKEKRLKPTPENYEQWPLYDRLYHLRSDIPAITHIDFSARIQSVSKNTNLKYWTLINEFKTLTNYSVIVNSSFNVRGEPIVCTPEDAYRCFMRSEMDYLVLGDYILDKCKQPVFSDTNWKQEFKLD